MTFISRPLAKINQPPGLRPATQVSFADEHGLPLHARQPAPSAAVDTSSDSGDRMLHPSLFKAYNARYGPFTVDACCDLEGNNRQLEDFWSQEQDCVKQDWTGKSVYCYPDHSNIDAVLCRYLDCFSHAPGTTRALFVLPDYASASWWQHLYSPRFHVVGYYPKGSDFAYP